jgi:hypothetical protein
MLAGFTTSELRSAAAVLDRITEFFDRLQDGPEKV